MRRRNIRTTRRSNPLRKRVEDPMVSPRHLADQVEGGCTVKLLMGNIPEASRLVIEVRFRISIYDHNRDEYDALHWKELCKALWVGFDGSSTGFTITLTRASQMTLMLEARYPGQGCLDRIRKLRVLRLAPAASPSSGVLLEVRAVLPTARRPPPPINTRPG